MEENGEDEVVVFGGEGWGFCRESWRGRLGGVHDCEKWLILPGISCGIHFRVCNLPVGGLHQQNVLSLESFFVSDI